ncbi:hypothetical protein [uncultured Jatrophihabitans sp.]|uniref:hypothetical protein n=1 Tax=uncultured Jatrophihabitans sp. TaxID=1610747 RepID=UPI0035CB331E
MANKHEQNEPDLHGGRMRVPRSRGAVSGLLLIVLGVWGLLIPLIGPYVGFGYTPDKTWTITAARFWLEILPGAVTAVGGLLLLVAANRIVTSLGAWLAVAGGAWFLVGPTLRALLHLGTAGAPIHKTTVGSTLETLLLFTGLGTLILFVGASVLGRLAVVSVRDVRAAQRRERDGRDDDDRAREHRDHDDHPQPTGGRREADSDTVYAGSRSTTDDDGGSHSLSEIPRRRRNARQ